MFPTLFSELILICTFHWSLMRSLKDSMNISGSKSFCNQIALFYCQILCARPRNIILLLGLCLHVLQMALLVNLMQKLVPQYVCWFWRCHQIPGCGWPAGRAFVKLAPCYRSLNCLILVALQLLDMGPNVTGILLTSWGYLIVNEFLCPFCSIWEHFYSGVSWLLICVLFCPF